MRGATAFTLVIMLVPMMGAASGSYEYDGTVGSARIGLPPIVGDGLAFNVTLRQGEHFVATVTWDDVVTDLELAAYRILSPCQPDHGIIVLVCDVERFPGCEGTIQGLPNRGEKTLDLVAPVTGWYRVLVIPDTNGMTIPFHLSAAADGEAPTVNSVAAYATLWPEVALCDVPS